MDDLYVDLELSADQKLPEGVEKKKLKSHQGLCNMKDKHGNTLKRVLVRGGPGSGKTMLVSKLAYDWTTKGLQNTKFDLLFALDLREVTKYMDLTDIIQDQLLPKISKQQLLEYIENNASSITYLLDGFDEIANTDMCADLKLILSNKWLQESLVIVTTRPHKFHDFVRDFGMYTHVDILKFSFQRINEFVVNFLNIRPYLGYIYNEVEKQTEEYELYDSASAIHPMFRTPVKQSTENVARVLRLLLDKRYTCTSELNKVKENAERLWELYSLFSSSRTLPPNLIELNKLIKDALKTIWKIYGPPKKYIQACSNVKRAIYDLLYGNFLQKCSAKNSSILIDDFFAEYLVPIQKPKADTSKRCQFHVEIQNKLDEIDSDLRYIENPSDYLYKPNENILHAVNDIRISKRIKKCSC